MNFQNRNEEKIKNEQGMVSMEDAVLAQFCVASKTLKMNFQFRKEEKVEIELRVLSMEGAALAQFFVLTKLLFKMFSEWLDNFFSPWLGLVSVESKQVCTVV